MRVTVEDVRQAYVRQHLDGWPRLLAVARTIAAERQLTANSQQIQKLIEQLKLAKGSEWHAIQARLTELFKKHDRLLDIAYPTSRATSREGT